MQAGWTDACFVVFPLCTEGMPAEKLKKCKYRTNEREVLCEPNDVGWKRFPAKSGKTQRSLPKSWVKPFSVETFVKSYQNGLCCSPQIHLQCYPNMSYWYMLLRFQRRNCRVCDLVGGEFRSIDAENTLNVSVVTRTLNDFSFTLHLTLNTFQREQEYYFQLVKPYATRHHNTPSNAAK